MTRDEMINMEVSNLSVNDWVYPNSNIPSKIIDIHGNAEEIIADNGIVDVCECYPVLLKKEMLQLNGFEHSVAFNKDFYTYNNREIICIWDNGIHINILGKDIVITTVPEFQHVLRMCGLIELANTFIIE